MKEITQLDRIERMLKHILMNDNHYHVIDGYVYGNTSEGKPFVILYPRGEHMKEKACRVYMEQFKKLPDFIPTDNIEGDTEANPNKTQARNKGIYHECPMFGVVTYDGKETQMGPEKRFGDVLWVDTRNASPTPHQAPPQPAPAPVATTSAATPAKTTAPAANGGKGDNDKELLKRKALAAIDEQMFFEDAAAYFGGVYTSPVLQKTMLIFCEKFELSLKEAIFAGLDAYITKRTEMAATDRETAHLNAAAAADKAFGGFQVPS